MCASPIKFAADKSEIDENNKRFLARREIYFSHGLDNVTAAKEIIDQVGPLNEPILEIGTGRGHTALALAREGYNVITVDIDLESLKTCYLNLAFENLQEQFEFYQMDARRLDFEDNFFGTVISINFFHHIEELNGVLDEMNRVLVPEGLLLLADVNKRGLEIIENVHLEEGRFHPHSGIEMKQIVQRLYELKYNVKSVDLEFESVVIAIKQK